MSVEKVLATGATGQIGNAVYMRLKEQPDQYDVYALDRSSTFSARVPKSWVQDIPEEQVHLCDLADLEGLRKTVRGMDVVTHLAADPNPRTWESVLNSNVIGTYNTFEACRLEGVGRIVVASSITLGDGYREIEPYQAILEKRYEDVPPDFAKVTVDMPAEPRSLYAAAKHGGSTWPASMRIAMGCPASSFASARLSATVRGRLRASILVSVRDIVQIWELCINADASLRFDIFWGMSNNDWRWVDIDHAREVLGYVPQARAEDNWTYDQRTKLLEAQRGRAKPDDLMLRDFPGHMPIHRTAFDGTSSTHKYHGWADASGARRHCHSLGLTACPYGSVNSRRA